MEAPNYIILTLVSVLFGIARYFFKDLHRKFIQSEKKNELLHDKVVKLEGKVERLDEKMPSDIANLERIMELKFEHFNKQFEELTKAITHAERTFIKLLQEVKK